jgi:integrase
LAYVQEHLELKYSPNTINTWITGIVKVSEQKGCEWTKEALKPVYSRINIGKAGFQTKKAESFSRDDVDCFWEKFSENTPANVFKKLLFCIWTGGFLRLCQLDMLCWTDMERTDLRLSITKNEVKRKVKSSDAPPERTKFVLPAQSDVSRCPVYLYDSYCNELDKYKVPRTGKLWKQLIEHKNGTTMFKNQNMGVHKLSEFAKLFAMALGLENVDAFTSHSFRHTAGSIGAEAGLTEDQLKTGGGWQSLDVAKGYIQHSKMNSENITSKVLFGSTDGNSSKKEIVVQRNLKNSIEFIESSTMGVRNASGNMSTGTRNNGSFVVNVFGGNLKIGDMNVHRDVATKSPNCPNIETED